MTPPSSALRHPSSVFSHRRASQPVVLALHGIMTRADKVNWTERFSQWMAQTSPGWLVLTQNYFAWPAPRLNWILNRFRAAKLAQWLAGYADRGQPIHIISHSNGAAVAMGVAKWMAMAGLRIESMLFIAGAISCDLTRSGLARLLANDHVGRAEAWWSPRDFVISAPAAFFWPYGRLGAKGFMSHGLRGDGPRVKNREFTGFSHGDYFHAPNQERTFLHIRAHLCNRELSPI